MDFAANFHNLSEELNSHNLASIRSTSLPLVILRHSERVDESNPDYWKQVVGKALKANNFEHRDDYSFSHDPPLSDPRGFVYAQEASVTLASGLVQYLERVTSSFLPVIDSSEAQNSSSGQAFQVHIYCSRTIRTVQTAVELARQLSRHRQGVQSTYSANITSFSHQPTIILSRGISRILACVQKRDKQSEFLFVSIDEWQRRYPDIRFIDGEQPHHSYLTDFAALPLPGGKLVSWRKTLKHIVSKTIDRNILNIIVGHRETIRHLYQDELSQIPSSKASKIGALPYCAIALFRPVLPNLLPAACTTTTFAENSASLPMGKSVVGKNMEEIQKSNMHEKDAAEHESLALEGDFQVLSLRRDDVRQSSSASTSEIESSITAVGTTTIVANSQIPALPPLGLKPTPTTGTTPSTNSSIARNSGTTTDRASGGSHKFSSSSKAPEKSVSARGTQKSSDVETHSYLTKPPSNSKTSSSTTTRRKSISSVESSQTNNSSTMKTGVTSGSVMKKGASALIVDSEDREQGIDIGTNMVGINFTLHSLHDRDGRCLLSC